MKKRDLEEYAQTQLAESLSYNVVGFQEISDVVRAIEDEESDFDGDSFCPYYSQQDDVIADYEREFGSEAEGICDEETYKASDWLQAKSAYAYAIAYVGFGQYFQAAKDALVEAVEEFGDDAYRELKTDDVVQIQFSNDCPHGWASHDRELADGTMIWESRQLDGSNGMARQVNSIWISCCLSPKESSE